MSGDYKEEDKQLYSAYNTLIEKGRKKFPNADSECLVFRQISNKFVSEVMLKTNEVLTAEKGLDSGKRRELIGYYLVRSNLIAMSQEAKWLIVTDD